MGGITLFVVANALFPFFVGIFVIYFFVNVMRFMKEKIRLDELRIEQTNRLIEIYKSNRDFKNL